MPTRSEATIDEDPATGRATLAVTARAELDVATVVAETGPLPPGVWDLWAELHVAGQGMARRLPAGDVPVPAPALLDGPQGTRLLVPYATTKDKLSFDLDAGTRALTVAARPVADRGAGHPRRRRRGRPPHPGAGPRHRGRRVPAGPARAARGAEGRPRRAGRRARARRPAAPRSSPACRGRSARARGGWPPPWPTGPSGASASSSTSARTASPACGARRRPGRGRRAPAASPLRRALARVGPLRAVVRALRR